MKIEAFIIAWNESEIIRMTIDHYQTYFDAEITIFDNYSDDGTDKIAEEMGCKVVKYGTPGVLDDMEYLKIKNNCWKNSNADWVIVCDADEILFWRSDQTKHYCFTDVFSGKTIVKPQGWDVYSNDMPKNHFEEVTTGYEYDNYAKCIMFKPSDIQEINYAPGAHKCAPVGRVIYTNKEDLTLMHYRCIGGLQRKIARNKAYRPRMSKLNLQKGYGGHYNYSDEKVTREWETNFKKCRPLW